LITFCKCEHEFWFDSIKFITQSSPEKSKFEALSFEQIESSSIDFSNFIFEFCPLLSSIDENEFLAENSSDTDTDNDENSEAEAETLDADDDLYSNLDISSFFSYKFEWELFLFFFVIFCLFFFIICFAFLF
jgi:hypothetical protein